jgi:glycosyltransferase involved in cell wall biosynthesis
VRQRYPTTELWVAGGVCSLLDETPGVVPLGVLNDLSDVYQAAWVVVNPCRFGTGLKIKTIEALAAGRPLVTTSAGGDGLEAQAGTAYLRSDNMDSIAGAIIDLFGNSNKREELRTQALTFMKTYHRQQLTTLDAVLAKAPIKS